MSANVNAPTRASSSLWLLSSTSASAPRMSRSTMSIPSCCAMIVASESERGGADRSLERRRPVVALRLGVFPGSHRRSRSTVRTKRRAAPCGTQTTPFSAATAAYKSSTCSRSMPLSSSHPLEMSRFGSTPTKSTGCRRGEVLPPHRPTSGPSSTIRMSSSCFYYSVELGKPLEVLLVRARESRAILAGWIPTVQSSDRRRR
jgi:hypothetical protein